MKLYDIPKESKIYGLQVTDGNEKPKDTIITFHHLDGLYSYCTTENGDVVHLSVATPLEIFKDGFKVAEKEEQ